jgi:hypothetical protein
MIQVLRHEARTLLREESRTKLPVPLLTIGAGAKPFGDQKNESTLRRKVPSGGVCGLFSIGTIRVTTIRSEQIRFFQIAEVTFFRNRPECQFTAKSYWPSGWPRAAALRLLSHHRHECHRNYGPLSYATVCQLVDDHQTLCERTVADRRHHSAAGPELIDQSLRNFGRCGR